ncbi:response regulator transcription factor [Microbacterium flavum]|uniref:Response regulator transcription factor n=1 Tax=Microbacterium flavum TaxID=415216 RepID=A0ABS5XXZ5_9MICO|nr:response regulator transcription factor [Microbacterium flavum]MBT8799276.1 response regulator transcription factor [Microbacterium flavum]
MGEAPLAFVVDDEPAMLEIITFVLETQGFRCESFRAAEPAWIALGRLRPDLVVLDVMLPGMSGVELCARIRAHSDVPVMLVTAKGESDDRIAGLEADADDYVVKPFHPRELALRAQRLVRRNEAPAGVSTRAGLLRVDPGALEAVIGTEKVALTMGEYRVLQALLTQPDEVIDFRALLIAGWGEADRLGGREMIKTTVYRLRHKLDAAAPGAGQVVESVRGAGYLIRSAAATTVTDL